MHVVDRRVVAPCVARPSVRDGLAEASLSRATNELVEAVGAELEEPPRRGAVPQDGGERRPSTPASSQRVRRAGATATYAHMSQISGTEAKPRDLKMMSAAACGTDFEGALKTLRQLSRALGRVLTVVAEA